MASTIEKIHRRMDPLVTRLRTAARIMKTAAKDAYFSKPEEADGLKNFAKDNKEIVNNVLESLNEGVQSLNNRFPGMADRVFDHAVDGPTESIGVRSDSPTRDQLRKSLSSSSRSDPSHIRLGVSHAPSKMSVQFARSSTAVRYEGDYSPAL